MAMQIGPHLRLPPTAAISSEEARIALFGNKDRVEPDRCWDLDTPELGIKCIGRDGLLLYGQGTLTRVNLSTGERDWERQTQEEPGLAVTADGGVTVVAFRDGEVRGIGPDGQDCWNFQVSQPVFNMVPGGGEVTTLTLEKQPDHQVFHVALAPGTGEVLWRQPGANYELPIPVGNGLKLLKASNDLLCVDPGTGQVRDRQRFRGYGRDLIGQGDQVWFLDAQEVRQVRVQDGKLQEGWSQPVEAALCTLKAPQDFSVLYVSAKDKILGLDPATGRELWQQPVEGEHHQYSVMVTEQGDLVVSGRSKVTCISPRGERRWDASHEGLTSLKVTPRGLMALTDPASPGPYRLAQLHPDTGQAILWAEVPRGRSTPWLDQEGRVLVTHSNRAELLQLPDPATVRTTGQVMLETSDSVRVDGVVVRKRGE